MKTLKKLLPLVFILPISAFASTQHDNYFCPSSGSLDFIPDSNNPYKITKSQINTWGGISGNQTKKNLGLVVRCLLIKAGRRSDSEDNYSVITWVRDLAKSTHDFDLSRFNVRTTRNSGKIEPDIYPEDKKYTINFAVYGTLKITTGEGNSYECPETIIYQGSLPKSPGIGMNVWSVVKNNDNKELNHPHLTCQDTYGKSHTFALYQAKSPENPQRVFITDAEEEYVMTFVKEN